ncbi:MAG: hypothetical protein JSV62_07570 [Promethearchaeota archaeon]|nr:MAG: hypothetical protein JSV62_07570 [Candidatus Lokiarchaeota archaeon]
MKNQGIEYYAKLSHPKVKFNRHVTQIYKNVKLEATSAYESVRRAYFTQPFVEYLRSIGIGDFLSEKIVNLEIVRNDKGQIIGQDYEILIKEWSIVEHLVARGIPNIEIATEFGLCKEDDSKEVRRQAARIIKNYLQGRWTIPVRDSKFREYTVENLRLFLNTMYIGRKIYSQYLNL